MSLKAFHIVFISISILLAFGFAGWSFHYYSEVGQGIYLGSCIASALSGIGLIVYEVNFLRKFKNVSLI